MGLRKRHFGGARLRARLFVMPAVCTRRQETNRARPISNATPLGSLFFLPTRTQHQIKVMIGAPHREPREHHHVLRPMSHLITRPLELVLEAAGVMAWVVSRVVVDVQPSTIVFPKQHNSHWPRQVAPQLPLVLTEDRQRARYPLAKIAERLSRHSGEGMKLDILSAMRAVCLHTDRHTTFLS